MGSARFYRGEEEASGLVVDEDVHSARNKDGQHMESAPDVQHRWTSGLHWSDRPWVGS